MQAWIFGRPASLCLTVLALVAFTACAPADDVDDADETDDAAAVEEDPMADEGGLTGTAWQLVAIRSMDDTEYVPEDPSQYTLTFTEDGAARILSHCNRGTGTYTSATPGQVQFGPIALTRMACPEPSIAHRYETQFEHVRSYVMEGGHLFLATMADGAIIEFAPLETAPE